MNVLRKFQHEEMNGIIVTNKKITFCLVFFSWYLYNVLVNLVESYSMNEILYNWKSKVMSSAVLNHKIFPLNYGEKSVSIGPEYTPISHDDMLISVWLHISYIILVLKGFFDKLEPNPKRHRH